MRPVLFPISVLFFAAACGQPSDDAALGSLEQPIIHGVDSTSADDSAVYVRTTPADGGAVVCTGTLIAPNLVATALHCVTKTDLGSSCGEGGSSCFSCRPDGTLFSPNRTDGMIGAYLKPEEVAIVVGASVSGATPSARGAQLIGTGSTQICRGDVAFVVLDRALDAPVSPVRLSYGVNVGDTVRVVGYGETETYGTSGRRVRDGVHVVDVGASSEDAPSISASPRTFVVDEGPCHGDSGGPAFAEDTNALVGIYSLSTGSCDGVGIRNVYSSLSLYSSFALDAFAAAGAEPILDEPPVAPTAPDVVPESGCTLNAGGATKHGSTSAFIALAALGLGLAHRRRRG